MSSTPNNQPDDMEDILLENQDSSHSSTDSTITPNEIECIKCFDTKFDNPTKKFHKVHTCTRAFFCDDCIGEYSTYVAENNRTCPCCRGELSITETVERSLSINGRKIIYMVFTLLAKISLEVGLVYILLQDWNIKYHPANHQWLTFTLIMSLFGNNFSILFTTLVCEIRKSIDFYLKYYLATLLYHMICLVIVGKTYQGFMNAVMMYIYIALTPINGVVFAIGIVIGLFKLFKWGGQECLEVCFDKKSNTRINVIELV